MPMKVVAGGGGLRRDVELEKAERALEERVRAEVAEQYATRLETAGWWKRFVLRRLMEWEIRRRLGERLCGASTRP
jgi:hypothetical protein